MTSLLPQVMAYTALPAAATILGGVAAVVRPPGARLLSALQHFAAGVVFAAVALELLPSVVREHATGAVVVGFTLGIGLMLGIRRLTEAPARAENTATNGGRSPTAMLVAVGVDLAIDGLLVAVGFAAGDQTGVLLTIALTLEVLFVGLAVAGALTTSGARTRRVIATTTMLALTLTAGAAISALMVGRLSGTALEVVFSFGAAALLFLVTEELLVEAHEAPENAATTAMFFAGFLLILVIDMTAATTRA